MRKSMLLVPLCCLVAIAAPAVAEVGHRCATRVLVTDQTGAHISNALVFTNASASPLVTVRSGEVRVELCAIAALKAEAPGFKTTYLSLTGPTPAHLAMKLQVGAVGNPFVVEDRGPHLVLASSEMQAQLQTMPAAPADQGAPPAEAGATLALIGIGNQLVLSGERLRAMPHQTVSVENGHTHATETYSGVPLASLLEQVGAPAGKDVHGKALSDYVVATGSDGYKAVIALAEAEPDFHPGQVLVADQLGGKPLEVKEGPFKLVVTEDKRPARSVHNLVKIELKQAE